MLKPSVIFFFVLDYTRATFVQQQLPVVVQKPLSYGLRDLEPTISYSQMDLHYNRHHKAYVTNLN